MIVITNSLFSHNEIVFVTSLDSYVINGIYAHICAYQRDSSREQQVCAADLFAEIDTVDVEIAVVADIDLGEAVGEERDHRISVAVLINDENTVVLARSVDLDYLSIASEE